MLTLPSASSQSTYHILYLLHISQCAPGPGSNPASVNIGSATAASNAAKIALTMELTILGPVSYRAGARLAVGRRRRRLS